jgi:peptide/nickel transport system permease protein
MIHLRPGRADELRRQMRRLTYDPLAVVGFAILGAIILVSVFAQWLTPYANQVGAFTDFSHAYLSPSLVHPFGTDNIGKDVLTQVLFGFRISLFVAVVVLAVSAPPGIILGLVVGYYGGWVETVLVRVIDIFLSLPGLVLALVIAGVLGPSLNDVILAIIAIWWTWYARVMYTVTKQLKNQPYVEAAKVQGAGSLRIMFFEILPNATSTLAVKATLDFGFIILIQSGMGFLGLGARPPTPDLGIMVASGMSFAATAWWIPFFPALALSLLIGSFNLIGNGLRDLFDVKVL